MKRSRGIFSVVPWLLVGAVIVIFGLSLPSVGLLVLAMAVFGAVVLSWGWGLPWLLVGAAMPVLWVAWKNRGGPGERCFETQNVSGCSELLDPLPWLVVGLVILTASAGIYLIGVRHTRSKDSASGP